MSYLATSAAAEAGQCRVYARGAEVGCPTKKLGAARGHAPMMRMPPQRHACIAPILRCPTPTQALCREGYDLLDAPAGPPGGAWAAEGRALVGGHLNAASWMAGMAAQCAQEARQASAAGCLAGRPVAHL